MVDFSFLFLHQSVSLRPDSRQETWMQLRDLLWATLEVGLDGIVPLVTLQRLGGTYRPV